MKKPFYKKWWFFTIIALVVIGLVFAPSEEEKAQREEEKLLKSELKAKEKEEKAILKENEKAEKEKEKELSKQEAEEEKALKEKEKEEKALSKQLEKEEKELAKQKAKEEKAMAKEEEKKKNVETKEEPSAPEEDSDQGIDRSQGLEELILNIIEEDLKGVSINQILINENYGKGDGSYIILPHLSWDVKNGAKRTRQRIEEFADHIAATLADEEDVSEITVFWEVPYHLDDNIAKFMYERSDEKMAKMDKWFAPVIR